MTTVNEYLKNTRDNYNGNFFMTIAFLILPILGYAMIHFQQSYLMFYFSIFFGAGFLLIFLIKPAYKILRRNALWWEMRNLALAPFGIGLLRIYWKPYQRMARKLASDEAIQGCENALESMSYTGGNPNPFKVEWGYFKEWFPKIEVSDETRDRRLELVEAVLCFWIKNEIVKAEKEIWKRGNSIMFRKLLKDVPEMADFLRNKLTKQRTEKDVYRSSEISPEAFKVEIKERTSWLNKLRENLTESNVNFTFKEMCKIQI